MRPENRGEGVISLRTAGDISLPRDRSRKGATSTMRGLIVPQGHNNPPTIIPLTHSRASRESGDYASSDVQVSPSSSSDNPGNYHAHHFVNIALQTLSYSSGNSFVSTIKLYLLLQALIS